MIDYPKNIAYTQDYKIYRESFDWLYMLNPSNTTQYNIENKYVLEVVLYEKSEAGTNFPIRHTVLKGILKSVDGIIITEFKCITGYIFAKLIHHRNGREYLIFNIDLYGYSIMDMSNLLVVSYVPETVLNKEETFIWQEKYYCKKNNILVISGCYWAHPSGLEFYDFSYPMCVPLPMYTAYNENNFINDLSLDYDVDFVTFSKLGECVVRYTDKNEQTKEIPLKIL
ncbi:MAG: hypothetical protein VB047_07795 [Anaerotignum propionicum]|uniref:hypothetical protein n=1 Tax=Anaerotignum propionicum TaxID=28446 RepID=UPI002B2108B0|nr:hypothetical protein [Anaerotignum propionicum]MEA5057447.1 hypothetical protein [Anaerotignum propionicum]